MNDFGLFEKDMNASQTENAATRCMRCGTPCRCGTPDPKAIAIVQATEAGFCVNCMIEHFISSIEGLRRPVADLGPEIFLDAKWMETTLRPAMDALLGLTQMPEPAIDWVEVVGNWGMPWPKGYEPKDIC